MSFFGDIKSSDYWGKFFSKPTVSPVHNISITESASPLDSLFLSGAISGEVSINLTSLLIIDISLQSS